MLRKSVTIFKILFRLDNLNCVKTYVYFYLRDCSCRCSEHGPFRSCDDLYPYGKHETVIRMVQLKFRVSKMEICCCVWFLKGKK
jgi:hypothetical protein